MNSHIPTDPAAGDNLRLMAAWIGTLLGAAMPRTWGEASAMLAFALTLWILCERGYKRYKRWRAGIPVVDLHDSGKGDL